MKGHADVSDVSGSGVSGSSPAPIPTGLRHRAVRTPHSLNNHEGTVLEGPSSNDTFVSNKRLRQKASTVFPSRFASVGSHYVASCGILGIFGGMFAAYNGAVVHYRLIPAGWPLLIPRQLFVADISACLVAMLVVVFALCSFARILWVAQSCSCLCRASQPVVDQYLSGRSIADQTRKTADLLKISRLITYYDHLDFFEAVSAICMSLTHIMPFVMLTYGTRHLQSFSVHGKLIVCCLPIVGLMLITAKDMQLMNRQNRVAFARSLFRSSDQMVIVASDMMVWAVPTHLFIFTGLIVALQAQSPILDNIMQKFGLAVSGGNVL